MAEIFLDNEPVAFEGPPPESLTAVHELLSSYLTQNGKVLVQFQVDGADILELPANQRPASYERVEARSASQSLAIGQMIEDILSSHGTVPQDMQLFAAGLLLNPWDSCKANIASIAEQAAPILEVLSYVYNFGASTEPLPAWAQEALELQEALQAQFNHFADAAENEDIARLSEILELHLAPLTHKCFECMAHFAQDALAANAPENN